MKTEIHPTAIIDPQALLGEGTTVGPYSIIGPKVRLGKNNSVGPHAVITGNTSMGDGNRIFPFASIGTDPQDLKFKGEDSILEIGSNNIIREYVTLQPGTKNGGMITRIGSGNLFMASSHVGHDCTIGDGVVMANSVGLSGHVQVGNRVIIGGLAGIHQFVRLGEFCFIAGGAMIVSDIPPFCFAQGDRATLTGINSIGLSRGGYSAEDIQSVKRVYREVMYGTGVFAERLKRASASTQSALAQTFLSFLSSSERGVTMPRRGSSAEPE